MTEKRIAVVTGGASGIGFGIAEALVKAGFVAVLVGRNEKGLAEAAERLGPASQWRRADVGARGDVEHAFSGFSSIDVLVNAAGFIRSERHVRLIDDCKARVAMRRWITRIEM